ncbi:putative bifunctional diguanylate cyclase/phosphodiesterase [Melissospora conviva]|uniref:putative bifunctional diguanylate cyclase/phosphodiesterase n=1 Tax=Melissospora conviva TaxID=3388432 RepID=UPI003F7D860D
MTGAGGGEVAGRRHGTTPGHASRFTALLLTAAVAAVVTGLLLPPVHPPEIHWDPRLRFAVAAAVFGLAQLARLRFRTATGMVTVTWGEAALIFGLFLVPTGWLPAAVFLGAGFGWLIISLRVDRRPVTELAHIAASMTLAVAAAVLVFQLIAAPAAGLTPAVLVFQLIAAPAAGLTPAVAVAAVAAAATYVLVNAVIGTATLALRRGGPVGGPLLLALRGKLLMFIGNVVVGLSLAALLDHYPLGLILAPPLLWLLQQAYRHRLGVAEERRTWRVLAETTGGLNRLDERGVATAGVRGAADLFGAEQVDVEVIRGDGARHRYRGDRYGGLTDQEMPATDAAALAGTETPRDPATPADPVALTDSETPAGCVALTHPLVVGATTIGRLRVCFPTSARPRARDRDVLGAYGDALAAALHDAATHGELRQLAARASYEAVHDPLTGLINRATLLDRGDQTLRGLERSRPVALLLLDLDHFKEVNNTLGHSAGDELLQRAAGRLRDLTGNGGLLGRLGGDEFALLLTAVPVAEEAAVRAYALRQAREIVARLAVPAEVAGIRISVEASVGVVVAAAGGADMTELLRRADIAMYQAKAGEGSVAFYDGSRDAASTDRLALLAELREALRSDDQLVLELQPAVDLDSGAPTGVEALIRWRHPRRGLLKPAEFIRPVEASEQLGAFTRYVVDKALTVAAQWPGRGLDLPISINLSARSLLDPRLPAEIAESLRRHRIPARRLVLEITETVVISELAVIDEVLATLRAMGVQIAVDDFGTGFSTLTFLTRVPVDELKVDRSFVLRMQDSPEAAAIVRTTVGLARELGLRVVAEGVETAEQRAALVAIGCTAAQGYHFHRPMPADQITAVLETMMRTAGARVPGARTEGAS